MFPDISFEKIAAKMESLKTAVFFDLSESIVKFPTSVVQILSANENLEIWLALPRPYPDISGLERIFPVELHFYNKALNYYINTEGMAELISNAGDIPERMAKKVICLINTELLIRVRVSRFEYFKKI